MEGRVPEHESSKPQEGLRALPECQGEPLKDFNPGHHMLF